MENADNSKNILAIPKIMYYDSQINPVQTGLCGFRPN